MIEKFERIKCDRCPRIIWEGVDEKAKQAAINSSDVCVNISWGIVKEGQKQPSIQYRCLCPVCQRQVQDHIDWLKKPLNKVSSERTKKEKRIVVEAANVSSK